MPAKNSYEITPEIQEIIEPVETGDGQAIFVTGAAGTGMSAFIEILHTETKKNLGVVAPTGVAAIATPHPRGKSISRLNAQSVTL